MATRESEQAIAPGFLRAGRRGDGNAMDRDLGELLVGQTVASIERGGLTEEGMAVCRVRFLSGDQMLILPVPVEPAVTEQTGVRIALAFQVQRAHTGRIYVPGVP